MGWPAPLDRAFLPAQGKPIKTLADARNFLLTLPKSRHKEPDTRKMRCRRLLRPC
jgi:hypothetical protein